MAGDTLAAHRHNNHFSACVALVPYPELSCSTKKIAVRPLSVGSPAESRSRPHARGCTKRQQRRELVRGCGECGGSNWKKKKKKNIGK